MAETETPIEAFKRATAATLRAIAEREDVTVTYGRRARRRRRRTRPPALPGRDLSEREAAPVRGAADSLALRLRLSTMRRSRQARAVGRDRARHLRRRRAGAVRGAGSRRMAGVATNLAAMLEERFRRQGLRAHDRAATHVTLARRSASWRAKSLSGARRRAGPSMLWRPPIDKRS